MKLEMLAHLTVGHHEADDDFRGWVNTMVIFLAVSGPNFMKIWDNVGDTS